LFCGKARTTSVGLFRSSLAVSEAPEGKKFPIVTGDASVTHSCSFPPFQASIGNEHYANAPAVSACSGCWLPEKPGGGSVAVVA